MSTAIEWTDETWNPVTGCTKVSQGCKNCYAARLWPKVSAAEAKRTGRPARKFEDVGMHPERLGAPLHWKKPRRVFVNSMSDMFHEDVLDEFIDEVFAIMGGCDDAGLGHTFQILTKRPARMLQYMLTRARSAWNGPRMNHSAFPPRNIWLGVSIEDQATADERIPLLLQTPAAVRFLSCEPLLGPIDLNCIQLSAEFNLSPTLSGRISALQRDHEDRYYAAPSSIDWVIAGGESGPKARPSHPDWFRSLRDQCAAAGVPFFFKQWGEWQIASAENGHHDSDMARNKAHWVHIDGAVTKPSCLREGVSDDIVNKAYGMVRVGKKAAGRLLDGREHMEYPA